jgi:23S rRNA (cytosine1962-C5)-methyltransferase
MSAGTRYANELPPCVVFEDDHLLVVHKPAGMNTHAASPTGPEGLYEWLRDREPRWATLAIIHRLDKDTSGILVFAKTQAANRSLTLQFTDRLVQKTYVAWTDRAVDFSQREVQSSLSRLGDRYVSTRSANGLPASTRFRVLRRHGRITVLEAVPLTGRTHQIRVHAHDLGCPLLGDELYGGTAAPRLHLHAASIRLKHPVSGEPVAYSTEMEFSSDLRFQLRQALISPHETDAFRLIHGQGDRWPGLYVDKLGPVMLAETDDQISPSCRVELESIAIRMQSTAVLHKQLRRDVRKRDKHSVSAELLTGSEPPSEWVVKENGVSFILRAQEGYSVGLFLDQRENRRRLLKRHIAAGIPMFSAEQAHPAVLNSFAYTCGFSVCAALAGARTTSLDLSQKYLEWGQRNFQLNQLDSAGHEFIQGDVFDWLRRWQKKGRRFDVIILDPPTFSTSKISGLFRVEKDYPRLIAAALPILNSKGVLLACANTVRLNADAFITSLRDAIRSGNHRILNEHWAPQPPDFPVTHHEPAHLKTVWFKIE